MQATALEDIFTAASSDLLELLGKCFQLDPNKRCTCSKALQMSYFRNAPYPSPREALPLPESIRMKYMDPADVAEKVKRKNPRLQNIESSGLRKKLF